MSRSTAGPTPRLMTMLLVGATLPLLGVDQASAGPSASAQVQVNTTTIGDQDDPSVATDPSGEYVVAWTGQNQDVAGGYGIAAQRFSPAGTPLGSETLVNTTVEGSQLQPSIAMDIEGDYVIAWAGPDENGSGVYFQRYDATGAPAGTETRVNTTTSQDQSDPSVAMDADGDYVIAWTSLGQDGDGLGVYFQRYSADGTPRGSETLVNTTTSASQLEPSVAMDADGDYVITWTSNFQDGSGFGVYFKRYHSSGVAFSLETPVNTTTAFDQGGSSVAMDLAGNYLVAWNSFSNGGFSFDVFAQRFDASGTPQGAEIVVNTTRNSDELAPSVAMDADGDALITWTRSAGGIYSQRFDATGVPQGPEVRVNTTTLGSQRASSVDLDADGDAVVSWASNIQDGSGYGVYARRLRGDRQIDLTLSQSDSPDQVAAAGRITYRIRVANRTDRSEPFGIASLDAAVGAASGVRVIVTPPEGATYRSAAGTGWACGTPGATITCRLATAVLPEEDAPDLRLSYDAPAGAGPALHSARVSALQVDAVATNDTDVERTSVLCAVGFGAPSYSVNEAGTGTATATVTRTGTDCGASSVAYSTSATSATAGQDYANVAGTLAWADGETTKTIAVPVIDDGLDERVEQLTLRLADPTGALLGARSLAPVTIVDDDDPPRVNFTTTTATVAEPGAFLDLTVQISEVSGQDVTVNLAKAGSATYLTDYFAPKRLTIPAGQRSVSFTVEVADDAAIEGPEIAFMTLGSSTGATIGSQKTYRLNITDND